METRTKAFDEKFCPECGSIIKTKAIICYVCGCPQKQPNTKNKMVAALLALFVGGFGFHKFYLGRPVIGFLYMAFCWSFIPSCIALIDFAILILMSNDSFDLKYSN